LCDGLSASEGGRGMKETHFMNNHHYNQNLKGFASQHRNTSTKSEIRIRCELLRNKKMLGYQFLRQRLIGNYIADFMCKELNLIIEIDGYSHNFKYEKDLERTKKLNELGFSVVRFTDDELKKQITNVERAIVIWIEDKNR
jgi:very-short-patch-repair endonuclease